MFPAISVADLPELNRSRKKFFLSEKTAKIGKRSFMGG